MTLDEISVVFSADVAPFEAAVSHVCALLETAGGQADALSARFYQSGSAAGQGLAGGLLSMKGRVASAAQALADAAASALQGALEIHSPSRLTYRLGAQFDEGLIEGVEQGQRSVGASVSSLGGLAADALSSSLLSGPGLSAALAERSLSSLRSPSLPSLPDLPPASARSPVQSEAPSPGEIPLSITIPLEIDGYRLGVAAIEGINRVTRGTGRIELNL